MERPTEAEKVRMGLLRAIEARLGQWADDGQITYLESGELALRKDGKYTAISDQPEHYLRKILTTTGHSGFFY